MFKNFLQMSSVLTIILLSLSISSCSTQSEGFHEKDQKANIPQLTSIQTVYGDIYDCIDVYKQPSLTHGQKIKMIPPQGIAPTLPNQRNENLAKKLWKLGRGCPKNTIPIRRTRKKINDQRINLRNNSRDHIVSHSLQWNQSGIDFAGIYTKPGKKFYSVAAYINLYNPKLSSGGQYSSAVVLIESGGASNLNQIQVGWTVNPTLYGDNNTRLYSAWTRDNHQSTGCFNMKCPGFIAVNNIVPLDYVFTDISKIEGKQYELPVLVFLDPRVGWWLAVGPNYDFIGCWPVTLFNSIQDHADSLRFGGQVFTPSANDIRPQMGSGIFKNGEYDQTCYIRRIRVADETYRYLYDVDNSYISGTDSRCYYEGDQSFKNENTGYSFVFGGKGGRDGSQCLFD